jgi:arylsulfatase
VKHVVPARFSATETLDVGSDLGSTVSESYKAPNAFAGEIGKVVVELKK